MKKRTLGTASAKDMYLPDERWRVLTSVELEPRTQRVRERHFCLFSSESKIKKRSDRVYKKSKVRDNLLRGKEGFFKAKKVSQTDESMTNYKNGGRYPRKGFLRFRGQRGEGRNLGGQLNFPCVAIIDVQRSRYKNRTKIMRGEKSNRMVNMSRRFPAKRDSVTRLSGVGKT